MSTNEDNPVKNMAKPIDSKSISGIAVNVIKSLKHANLFIIMAVKNMAKSIDSKSVSGIAVIRH